MLEYHRRLAKAVGQFDWDALGLLDQILFESRAGGNTVFVIGNGGSAATASHIANDWMIGTNLSDPPLKVIALTDNVASITAAGNDFGYDLVFSRQLERLSVSGDVLIAISASGRSENILSAVTHAKRKGLRVIGFVGFDGGQLSEEADLSFVVETRDGDYGVVEDVHLALGHAVKELLMARDSLGD